MRETSAEGEARPLRADARHNRSRILAAARDVFVEQGPGAALEEISRRAGTGIATLYRRFPDRYAVQRAVILDALERTIEAAKQAADEEPSAFGALTRYMHRTLDIRTAAVIPALLEQISPEDVEIRQAQEQGKQIAEELTEGAHREGTLRADVTSGDIGMLIVRLSRPLPGPFPRELNDSLGHRHLDLLLNGLRAAADRPAEISGPSMSLEDLRQLNERPDDAPDDLAPAAGAAHQRDAGARGGGAAGD